MFVGRRLFFVLMNVGDVLTRRNETFRRSYILVHRRTWSFHVNRGSMSLVGKRHREVSIRGVGIRTAVSRVGSRTVVSRSILFTVEDDN